MSITQKLPPSKQPGKELDERISFAGHRSCGNDIGTDGRKEVSSAAVFK